WPDWRKNLARAVENPEEGGVADREQVREDDLTVDFNRPNKKSQSNISEQEIAKAINMENSPGQNEPVGGKIKKDGTPKSPGGGMGAQ
ncbi:MAG: hypothetical protein Q7I94_03190, partial [Candidatus Contubernalis sp.]|nr:hypothetical protein [Candidatus Contubernalis sp.]